MSPLIHHYFKSWPFAQLLLVYIAVMLTITVPLSAFVAYHAASSETSTLAKANIEGCQRQNDLRRSNRMDAKVQKKQTKNFEYGKLLPDASHQFIHDLRQQQLQYLNHKIDVNHSVNCEAQYPD